MKNIDKNKIVLATGGSGGHILPAISVGNMLGQKGFEPLMILDVDPDKYSIGKIPFRIIKTGKNPKSIRDIFRMIGGFFQAFFLLLKNKPALVIGFGGYASFPVLLAARLLHVKILLQEQNSYMGKVNHMFGNHAEAIMTAYREIYGVRFEDMNKIVFTGNPIRDEFIKINSRAYEYPKAGNNFNILIIGGSGGAKFFSENLAQAFENLPDELRRKIYIHQQVREEDMGRIKDVYGRKGIRFEVRSFFGDTPKKMADAHLIISRAGALAISEIMAAGRPSILVPYPHAASNHQMLNAKYYGAADAAIVVDEGKFNRDDFGKMLASLMGDEKRLEELAENAKKSATLDANHTILNVIKETLVKE